MTQLTNGDIISIAGLSIVHMVSIGAWVGNLMRRVQKLENDQAAMNQWRMDMKAESTAMQSFRETMLQTIAKIEAKVDNTNSELDRIQRYLEQHKP